MLCTPIPGTALYEEHRARGTLLSEEECPDADAHGQLRFNFRHPSLPPGRETDFLLRGFRRDFEVNGPSVVRIARTLLLGWRRHKSDPDRRVRERYRRECADLPTTYAGALWAAQVWLGRNRTVAARIRSLRAELVAEFGWRARLSGPIVGLVLLVAMWLEQRRLRRGRTYEPPTFYESCQPAVEPARGETELSEATA
jgi:hypothetical protein